MAFQFTNSYTCVKEFVPSFPKEKKPAFEQPLAPPLPEWVPEAPYPKIYTNSYKKTLLSTL